ncbi:hypothetical protein [Roseiarcus fermentans]|uniref:hypothetical protein n=1 Tax=Roseiarcus fermentans TaxID=1473586 RepID=UPI0011BEC677|nr:hypothetical protein [Roseiarcus fermentans]
MKLGCAAFLIYTATACFLPQSSPRADDFPAARGSDLSFRDRVIAIDKAMGADFFGSILGYDALLGYKPFNDLASHASGQIDAFDEFVSEAHPTHQQVEIAILSMHRLGAHEYTNFLRKAEDLYGKALLTYWEFISALFPGEDWTNVLVENYDDPDVRAFLETVAARTDIKNNLKSEIEEILSGKAWNDLRTLRANCCTSTPPQSTK